MTLAHTGTLDLPVLLQHADVVVAAAEPLYALRTDMRANILVVGPRSALATRTVGVIGPTRMDYSRAIALVDGTTQVVTRVLRDAN